MLSATAWVLAASATDPAALDRITVTARRDRVARGESVSTLDAQAVERIAATHANEAFARIPGAWISRGSGQEQLMAIRSPVLAGTGACGAFLLLEDGVPTRPAGLCNVNQLFELDTEQAGAIEVLRGPGTAVHGSNALHGVVNVRPPHIETPGARSGGALEGGSDGYWRLTRLLTNGKRWRWDSLGVDAGSFRVDERYRQIKFMAQWQAPDAPGAPRLLFSGFSLGQDTAGFVVGEDAYRDDARRRLNANPEAFRDADAYRLQGHWNWSPSETNAFELVPYARRDSMQFLQHFTPGKPHEKNGSHSAGLQAMWRRHGDWDWQFGLDLERARGSVLEVQAQPLSEGSAAQRAIRPAGRHYDYRVDATSAAAFAQLSAPLAARWTLEAGLRAEALHYRYDNRMAAGNLREDGTLCDFGGCLFNRPADRRDRFEDANAQLALAAALDERHSAFVRVARAFRFPQAAELYRLQRGQDVAQLDEERLDSVELGLRGTGERWRWSAVTYASAKRHVILRDAFGINLSDGRTRHRGIELDAAWRFAPRWELDVNAAYAIQRYAFDRALAGGETIRSGDEIDTAPRWLGGARLRYEAPRAGDFELEWVHQGAYFLDAANSARYPGHELLHLRWRRALGKEWSVSARLMNLGDRRYAERADLAFGEERYFPGAGRSVFLTLEYR